MRRFLWHAKDLNEGELGPFFITALLDMNASLILQDRDHNYLCVTGLPDIWRLKSDDAPDDRSVFGAEIGARLADAKSRALETRQTEILEVTLEDGGVFEFRVLAFSGHGAQMQFITTIIDRGEDRRREKVLHSLLRDVSHRSKNLLAIIQSIVTQTSQYTDSIEAYVQKLRGRIFSLSRSQDLVTDSGWRGAFARELLEQQVSAYIPNGQQLITFEGENLLLSPNVTMHLGLAFHELLINAINFGSFLPAGQTIVVTIAMQEREGRDFVSVSWREPLDAAYRKAGQDSALPVRRLGTAILERVVPASVNGNAEYSVSQSEVRYGLVFPADARRAA
ncbi:sensor histidine kinase [Rhizobium sp. TRM95796]|uniref:sensor histidine kinase n=1 Tax=Rhizobium sp. TRM95796 TaxID=2979862 RepID=UPI0021E8B7D3|nr:sensor histidine kinase [Rhizobium sp. TRM95796]MCV3766210.1 sensor histidine kinase [Rhizobium sp. TRM95796]